MHLRIIRIFLIDTGPCYQPTDTVKTAYYTDNHVFAQLSCFILVF